MNRDDAKRALETIEILKAHNTYTEADAITIINNLMKRSFADGKQYIKDQQKSTKEYWTMIFNNGNNMSTSKGSEEEAIRHLTELREENPGDWDEAYVTKVREVMDNE